MSTTTSIHAREYYGDKTECVPQVVVNHYPDHGGNKAYSALSINLGSDDLTLFLSPTQLALLTRAIANIPLHPSTPTTREPIVPSEVTCLEEARQAAARNTPDAAEIEATFIQAAEPE